MSDWYAVYRVREYVTPELITFCAAASILIWFCIIAFNIIRNFTNKD